MIPTRTVDPFVRTYPESAPDRTRAVAAVVVAIGVAGVGWGWAPSQALVRWRRVVA